MKLRLGLIGRGAWGRNIERTLQGFDDVSIVTIGRSETNTPAVDGVLIATPSTTHANLALRYLEKGIATFIEKPMATSTADAERIKVAAAGSGAVVFIGHIYLYNPAFWRALEELPALGGVRHLICEGMGHRPPGDSSVLWEWLPHHVSMARSIFGVEPSNVAAWGLSAQGTAQDRPEAAAARFSFAGGSAVSIVSLVSPLRKRVVTMACRDGTLVFDDAAQEKLVVYRNGKDTYTLSHEPDLPLTLELRAFVDAVRNGGADASQLETGIAITRIIETAELSMRSDGLAIAL
jgi:UDP-N-acetylglucosamine 3-dehydrogenase